MYKVHKVQKKFYLCFMEGGRPGRPTKYNPPYHVVEVRRLCLLGLTDKELAAEFDISEMTLNEWKNRHPEFERAMKTAKRPANAQVAESLFKIANGYDIIEETKELMDGKLVVTKQVTKHIPPNVAAGKLFLHNREPELWREKIEMDHTSKGEKLGTVPIIVIQNPHETDPPAI